MTYKAAAFLRSLTSCLDSLVHSLGSVTWDMPATGKTISYPQPLTLAVPSAEGACTHTPLHVTGSSLHRLPCLLAALIPRYILPLSAPFHSYHLSPQLEHKLHGSRDPFCLVRCWISNTGCSGWHVVGSQEMSDELMSGLNTHLQGR